HVKRVGVLLCDAFYAYVFVRLFRGGNADQAASETGHEIDGRWCNMFGRQDEIAFVLPIRVVDYDDHPAAAQLSHGRFDRIEVCFGRLLHRLAGKLTSPGSDAATKKPR